MKKYIGTKIIKADPNPMTYREYCESRGWECPKDRELAETGYKVGYPDANGEFNGLHEGGCDYISWSPQDVFEAAYKRTTGLTFGHAIEAAKKGHKIARKGWNGAGMFAYIVPAASYPAQTGAAKSHFGENDMVQYREYWALKTAQGDVATWAPSGSDSLAEDWMIIE